jgi:hypothetical protein
VCVASRINRDQSVSISIDKGITGTVRRIVQ